MNIIILFIIAIISFGNDYAFAWMLQSSPKLQQTSTMSRKNFFQGIIATATSTGGVVAITTGFPQISKALDDDTTTSKKLFTDEEMKEIVKADIIERQFLATGKLTRSIYDPSAKFTDEIDTYELNQWITGTQKLFVGDSSNVRLIGDINVSSNQIDFKFDEDLMFNIPFRPTVSLSGTVILQRDSNTGLITSYREYWDQDVFSVLKTAKF